MFSIAILLTGETGNNLISFQDYNAQTIGIILLWLSAFLTLYTGFDYLRKGIHHVINEDDKNPRFTDDAFSVDEEKVLNAEFTSLNQLLRESDFITLHVPLTDETEYMIGNDEFALMKKTAYLIHTARGKVIDDYALVAALKEGRLAGAALDVYESEFESGKTKHSLIQTYNFE